MAKKLHIKTYGCQMNVYDSARMADVLAPLGYESVGDAESADLVILNTCHIREKAAEKVFSELGRLRRLKDRRGADDLLLDPQAVVAEVLGSDDEIPDHCHVNNAVREHLWYGDSAGDAVVSNRLCHSLSPGARPQPGRERRPRCVLGSNP